VWAGLLPAAHNGKNIIAKMTGMGYDFFLANSGVVEKALTNAIKVAPLREAGLRFVKRDYRWQSIVIFGQLLKAERRTSLSGWC
jgi:hypothetical protein